MISVGVTMWNICVRMRINVYLQAYYKSYNDNDNVVYRVQEGGMTPFLLLLLIGCVACAKHYWKDEINFQNIP